MQYPVCGITVLAPEDSLTDDVCRLCEARQIPYHRIDAKHTPEGTPKSNWIGMNPLFISRSLSGDALHQAIVKKAVIFSDVMQVITDLKGKADSCFTGLNRQMLANLAILVMNTVPVLYKRQATPADLQLLINNLEKTFSLFRKFRVAMFCAIQTLDPFEKNEIRKYLKGVILGCAHIFVFGRSSLSDMEVFSAMAGIHDEVEEQSTVSEITLSADSPTLSYSSRETFTQKNLVEETDIRMKDFPEITLFTTQNGRPLPPLHARVEFLRPADWKSFKNYPLTAEVFRPYATAHFAPYTPSADRDGHIALQSAEHISEYHCHAFEPLEESNSTMPKGFSYDIGQPRDSLTSLPSGSKSFEDHICQIKHVFQNHYILFTSLWIQMYLLSRYLICYTNVKLKKIPENVKLAGFL